MTWRKPSRTLPLSHASSPNTAPSASAPPDTPQGLPRPADHPRSPAHLPTPYFWFLAGTGSWFMAMGMQGVLFSWLVVGVLKAEAEWVGITQSAMMIPAVLLALPGGTIADRSDQRRLLMILHLLGAGFRPASSLPSPMPCCPSPSSSPTPLAWARSRRLSCPPATPSFLRLRAPICCAR